MGALIYGNTPVPFTASWTGEEDQFFVGYCRHASRLAIRQREAQGEGRPRFGSPHSDRQRKVIAQGLCDLCGKPLAARAKVSLSHARPVPHSANGWEILQVEPLLHKECAALSMAHCPSLKRDIRDGSLCVRQVKSYDVQMALMSAEYVETLTGERRQAVGHAKVQLKSWLDRDADWLSPTPAGGRDDG